MQWVNLSTIPRKKIRKNMEKCWSDGGSTGSKPSFCGFSARLARARVGPVKISTETLRPAFWPAANG